MVPAKTSTLIGARADFCSVDIRVAADVAVGSQRARSRRARLRLAARRVGALTFFGVSMQSRRRCWVLSRRGQGR